MKRICQCDLWWAGNDCNKSQLTTFDGVYIGSNDCEGGEISIKLAADNTQPNRMWLNDDEMYIEFTDEARFIIPEQVYQGQTVMGEGQMIIDALSLRYSYLNDSIEVECHVLARL